MGMLPCMDLRQRIANTVVGARRDLGWTQRRLAAEAGVAQPTVVKIEGGEGGSVEVIERLLGVLGIRVSLAPPPLPGGQDRADVAHRTGIAVLRRLHQRAAMPVTTEQAVADGPVRGWIDLLSFQPTAARLVVTEVKSELRDLGATLRQVDLYARTALQPARALGWRPKEILVVLAVLATEEADAFVAANRVELAATFPLRGRQATRAMLDGGPVPGRALIAIDPFRPGRQAITSFRVDGRRQPFPFVSATDLRRALDERARGWGRAGD
jgi:transcriptional regulator with XRE-family HTH domain